MPSSAGLFLFGGGCLAWAAYSTWKTRLVLQRGVIVEGVVSRHDEDMENAYVRFTTASGVTVEFLPDAVLWTDDRSLGAKCQVIYRPDDPVRRADLRPEAHMALHAHPRGPRPPVLARRADGGSAPSLQ